jgi:hypothetical protein
MPAAALIPHLLEKAPCLPFRQPPCFLNELLQVTPSNILHHDCKVLHQQGQQEQN